MSRSVFPSDCVSAVPGPPPSPSVLTDLHDVAPEPRQRSVVVQDLLGTLPCAPPLLPRLVRLLSLLCGVGVGSLFWRSWGSSRGGSCVGLDPGIGVTLTPAVECSSFREAGSGYRVSLWVWLSQPEQGMWQVLLDRGLPSCCSAAPSSGSPWAVRQGPQLPCLPSPDSVL